MKFFGELNYDSKKIKLEFKSTHKFKKFKDVKIFLNGKITDIYLDNYKLTIHNQEKIISKLYKDYKEKFINFLDGYFFIILIDKKTNSVFLFNNRYSNTTCYYYQSKKGFVFSDKINPIIKKTKLTKSPNMDVINLFLNSGYSFSEKTYLKNINRLIPGFYLKFQKKKISFHKYSNMSFNRKPIKNLRKAVEKYELLWHDALSRYFKFNKTKSVGSALSGGKDTSYVVWSAANSFNKPIHTYTCYYQYKLFNEIDKAYHVTKKVKGIHHKIYVDESDLDLLPELIRISEEPVLSSSIALYKMMKIGGEKVDTILTGDGGNNIFHHLYPVSEIHNYVKNMPYFLRNILYKSIKLFAQVTGSERLWELKYAFYPFSFKNPYKNYYQKLICYRHFTPEQRKGLLNKNYFETFDETNNLGQIKIEKTSFDNDLINARFVYGNMQYVSTFHEHFAKELNLNLFPPYQNKKLMDFICSLPYSLMNKGNTFQRLTNKADKMFFHKLALKKHFSEKFVESIGLPFDQPFHGWFENRPKIVYLLFNRLKKRGWYNLKFLNKLYKEHKKQQLSKKHICQLSNHGYRIMTLLSLELWCMEFIDDKNYKQYGSLEKYLAS